MRGRLIGEEELAHLALGAGILGTGGGMHPYLEWLNARKLYRAGAQVRLIGVDELTDDDVVAEMGYLGAPLASKERLTDPAHATRPVRMMEAYAGVRFTAVMPSEIGTANGIRPILVAASLGIPLVDADTMGRAFPELQMSSFVFSGMPLHPLALADVRDNELFITEAADAVWTERIGRRICTELGAISATCRPPRSAAQIRDHAVHGSVSRSLALGKAVLEAVARHEDPIESVLAAGQGSLLFRGKVGDVLRRTTDGFLRGEVRIDGLGPFQGTTMLIDFQNEWTVCRLEGTIVHAVPDLVCILDDRTGEAIGTETIRYGLRIGVVGIPAHPVLTTPVALSYVGPRAFGHDFDHPLYQQQASA